MTEFINWLGGFSKMGWREGGERVEREKGGGRDRKRER